MTSEKNTPCRTCVNAETYPHRWPCSVCREAMPTGSREYGLAPLMWEQAPEPQTAPSADAAAWDDAAADPVNHPAHYETGRFECIEVMLECLGRETVMGFCLGNAFKYLYRHRRKGGDEDLKKAVWYLGRYFETKEEELT